MPWHSDGDATVVVGVINNLATGETNPNLPMRSTWPPDSGGNCVSSVNWILESLSNGKTFIGLCPNPCFKNANQIKWFLQKHQSNRIIFSNQMISSQTTIKSKHFFQKRQSNQVIGPLFFKNANQMKSLHGTMGRLSGRQSKHRDWRPSLVYSSMQYKYVPRGYCEGR